MTHPRKHAPYVLVLVLAGAALGALAIWKPSLLAPIGPAHAEEAVSDAPLKSVWVIQPERRTISRVVRMAAEIRPSREAHIYGKVSGYALAHPVEVGTRVDPSGADGARQVLLEVAVPDLDARVVTEASRVARAAVAITEANAEVIQAQASVVDAQQGAAEARALARQAKGLIRAAEAVVGEARAELDLRETLYRRLAKVLAKSPNLVAQDQVDRARGAVQIAQAQHEAARIGVDKARDDEKVAAARSAAAAARIQAAEAGVAAARAGVTAAEAEHALAAARKVEAETLQGFATIRAPFAGVVAERHVDTGDLVMDATRNSGAMPLFRVVADDALRVRFFIADRDAPYCRVGSEVEFTVDVIEDETFHATLTRIADALDPKTRTMEVEAELDNPRDAQGRKRLRADMFARVRVDLEKHENVLTLPARCVLTKKRKSHVLVVDADNVVKPVDVQIGADDGTVIVIEKGLSESARVIYRGGNTVSKDQRVDPRPYSPSDGDGE